MLKQLSISGFTLINHAEVPFRKGFTAITGETGAGKSVLLKALRMVCGDKAQASMVRAGESKAVIEGIFDISQEPKVKKIVDSLGIDSDDELIIRREILENGKGRTRVNGNVVNQADLQEIGEHLIQMHGQSEQLLLRDTRTHTQMLDDYAGLKHMEMRGPDGTMSWRASAKQKSMLRTSPHRRIFSSSSSMNFRKRLCAKAKRKNSKKR